MVPEKKFVIVALIIGITTLGIMFVGISQGNVRQTPIFYPERIEQTVAFRDIEGKVRLVGILGVGGEENPTLVMRINFAYILTVINDGNTEHRLYIDGLEVQTDLLKPGEADTLTIITKKEGVYNYYDKGKRLEQMGQLKAVSVLPSDKFEGILRDL